MALFKTPLGAILMGTIALFLVYFIMLIVEILKSAGANQTFGPGIFTYVLMKPLFWIIALGIAGCVIWFVRYSAVKG